MQTTTLHTQDFYAWARQQAELLRSLQLAQARQLSHTCPFSEAEIFEELVELAP
jgi:hypothetical protein